MSAKLEAGRNDLAQLGAALIIGLPPLVLSSSKLNVNPQREQLSEQVQRIPSIMLFLTLNYCIYCVHYSNQFTSMQSC